MSAPAKKSSTEAKEKDLILGKVCSDLNIIESNCFTSMESLQAACGKNYEVDFLDNLMLMSFTSERYPHCSIPSYLSTLVFLDID